MDNPIPVDLGRVAQDLQIRRVQVESVVQLLDESNTVPFITRYRKERTGNLNEVVIHEIQLRVQRLRELADRKETILKAIEAQGKLSPDLAAAIRAAENPKRLEDLYLPFKPKKRTKASDARDKGLEPLAVRIWNRDETLTDLNTAAAELVNPDKGLESVEKVLEGVGHILAEAISEMAAVRDSVRKVVWKTGKIATSRGEIPEGQGLEFRDYFNYSEPLSQVPPHRVLAINRGDKEGPLKIKLEVSRPDLEVAFFHQIPLDGHPQAVLFRSAAIDALDRLILPSMEREVRRDLTEAAERHAVDVFARNLRSLLLQPPIPKQVVLAIDPGLRSGCKVAVLDPHGNMLDQTVVFPHAPQNRRSEAKHVVKDLVGKYQVGVVAIGNGTACRETEELIAEIIAEGIQFSQLRTGGETSSLAQSSAPEADETGGSAPAPNEPVIEPVARVAETDASQVDQTPVPESENQPPPTSPQPAHEAADHLASPQPAHEAAGHHASSVPEATGSSRPVPAEPVPASSVPDESLPPIAGGAPEGPSTESEAPSEHHCTSTDGAAPSPDHETAAPHQDHAATRFDGEPSTEAEPPAFSAEGASSAPVEAPQETKPETASTEFGLAVSDIPQAAESQGAVASTPPGEPGAPLDGTGILEVTTEGQKHAEAAAISDPGVQPVAEASPPVPEAKAAHEPRRGTGRQDHGRPRGPRSKPAASPPPPPSPPAPHPADQLLAQLAYVIVNEAGASVYSTSQVGREELPEFDATLRSAISIGRRLQDPLAELVKIEPQNIGVGLYQHDVNPKQLKETLEAVISSCVNFVGVDLNTASISLLRHVSGLNQLTARRIVEYRKEKGAFTSRDQLMQVEGIGPATFTQGAGFLKIPEGLNPLDRTWVHPESYEVAARLLEKFEYPVEVVRNKEKLPELQAQLAVANPGELAKELGVGEFTLRDITEALGRPERDPRDDLPKPIFKKGILKLEDLTAGMELKGTVLNVVDFGAFVDIGLKDSGLVHISQLANRYIKSPHDVVSVGDVVNVWVMSVDQERKRVSLTMVKPGTERQRGSGPRRGQGAPGEPREGQGQGRRDRSRSPRPSGSALTSPPVGAAPITALADPPPRRFDRDRGGPPGAQGHVGSSEGVGHGHGPGGGPHPSGGRPGPGPGSGRGGPRGGPYGHGPGPGRPGPARHDRPQAPRGPGRPARPSPPPPPLSKEALSGSEPLRTFGQLKQLWEARVEAPEDQQDHPGPRPLDRAPDASGPRGTAVETDSANQGSPPPPEASPGVADTL
jgi:uncharacterized protein